MTLLRLASKLLVVTTLSLGAAACASDSSGSSPTTATLPPPTEAEVRDTLERIFHDVYFKDNGLATIGKVVIDVTSPVVIGKLDQKQVDSGAAAQPVYPVQMNVTVTITYSNNPQVDTRKRGTSEKEVFLYYKDAFDKWTFKTGTST